MQTPNESAAGGVAGTYQVLYAVMPELPAATRAVQVVLGQGEVISDVPVQDGLLEPTVPGSDPVPLGTGWPTVDLGGLSAAREPGVSTLPLRTTIVSLDGALTNRSTRDEVSVDLSADVLFAVDKATLTARAGDQIRKAAAQVNAGAAGGRVAVVGYTDATGTTAHNLDLSKRRAQAVAAALKPLLTGANVALSVDGKGEADPVADNGTDDGRRQNRRVSIIFTKAAP
jgi:outer membrane protein OmpA-like peptidoglycan-associated protein